jgi:hypothetical protein
MSLDFFFVPLATKVGASLDQVKVSREERRGRRVLGADFFFRFRYVAHHMSACGISPRQRIHTDTHHTANPQTPFQHLHRVVLLCTGTQSGVAFPVPARGCPRHIFCRTHRAGPADAMDRFRVRFFLFEHIRSRHWLITWFLVL